MITLRKYLYGEVAPTSGDAAAAHDFCDALLKLTNCLLDGLEQHVFSEPHSAFQPFGAEVRRLRELLDGEAEPGDIRKAVDDALALLRAFRQVRDQVQQSEAHEVQKMVTMMNDTIGVLASGSERSVTRLKQVESDLKHASGLKDIVALRARINACMVCVREERNKGQQETAQRIGEMESGVQRAQEGFARARAGIATRTEAEKRIAEVVTNAESAMAVIVLDLIPTIKSRFNQITAERFVSAFAQDVSERLPSPHRLFRWNEQSLVVELGDTQIFARRVGDVRERLGQMPRERQLSLGNRSAVFSNAHRWTLLRLSEAQTAPAVISRINQFVAQ